MAGVPEKRQRSVRRCTKLRHTARTKKRSITAFRRRPKAMVSRRWCAMECRTILCSRSTGNSRASRSLACAERCEPFGPRGGFG
jgi:hypothetical protein